MWRIAGGGAARQCRGRNHERARYTASVSLHNAPQPTRALAQVASSQPPTKVRDFVARNYTLSASNAATFSQLYLRPRDMLKLGLLFQQEGRWNGRQIVSRDWVTRSSKQWSTVGDQAYGYFWWHQWVNAETAAGPRRVDMIVATGNGGPKIYLVP